MEEKTKSARRAAHALKDAGFHGYNRLNPKVAKTIYNLALPRLLYGLDRLILLQKDIDILNDFHKDMLRRIQHLAQHTALPIVCGLVGSFQLSLNYVEDNLHCLEILSEKSV